MSKSQSGAVVDAQAHRVPSVATAILNVLLALIVENAVLQAYVCFSNAIANDAIIAIVKIALTSFLLNFQILLYFLSVLGIIRFGVTAQTFQFKAKQQKP